MTATTSRYRVGILMLPRRPGIRDGTEKADQISISTGINGRDFGLGRREVVRPATSPGSEGPPKVRWDPSSRWRDLHGWLSDP